MSKSKMNAFKKLCLNPKKPKAIDKKIILHFMFGFFYGLMLYYFTKSIISSLLLSLFILVLEQIWHKSFCKPNIWKISPNAVMDLTFSVIGTITGIFLSQLIFIF